MKNFFWTLLVVDKAALELRECDRCLLVSTQTELITQIVFLFSVSDSLSPRINLILSS
ncbi:hypothetical protein [Fischerella sp. JS2]|uniref:hypothetical protein n=1 Tax=Fischerella sp. JS2 TaxID=2597771 RepID=UPI0028ED36EA|nr:hypothetical protein [Fischerella sp. JS2]